MPDSVDKQNPACKIYKYKRLLAAAFGAAAFWRDTMYGRKE